MFLLLCKCSIDIIVRHGKMKWQATNSFRLDINSTSLVETVFYGYFARSNSILESNFILSPTWSICPFIFFMSQGTLASPRTKTIAKFVEKGNLTTIWQQFIWNGKKMKTQMEYQIFFFNVGWCSCSWRDIYNCCLCEIFAIKNVLRVTSLIFYPISCNAKRCAICF